jgi:hypothetical protein
VPLHKELLSLGFLEFVSSVRKEQEASSWLFPDIAPDKPGALKGWTKWFSRYIRDREVESPDKVFHSRLERAALVRTLLMLSLAIQRRAAFPVAMVRKIWCVGSGSSGLLKLWRISFARACY